VGAEDQYKKDRIVEVLRDEIDAGLYDGKKLPSERDLRERFEVARTTVRAAYVDLRSEGKIVAAGRSGYRPRKTDPRVITAAAAAGPENGGDLDAVTHVAVWNSPVPQEIANRLQLADGEDVIVRESLVLDGDVEVMLRAAWFPMRIAEGTPIAHAVQQDSPRQLLADAGYPPSGKSRPMIRARLATSSEAERLRLPDVTPCTDWIRVYRDKSGKPLAVEQILIPGDRAALEGPIT